MSTRLQPTGAGEYLRLRRIAHLVNAAAPPAAFVLDVGGGTGILGRRLRRDLQLGYTVVDDIPVGFGRRLIGDLWDLPVVPGSVDVIVCSDVLEHVQEDAAFVSKIMDLMAPAGLVVIHVPALRTSAIPGFEGLRTRAEAEDHQAHPHVRDGYTRAGLQALLDLAAPTGSVTEVVPSFTTVQAFVADLDWLMWRRRLNFVRPLTYVGARMARGVATSTDKTGGHLGIIRLPVSDAPPAAS